METCEECRRDQMRPSASFVEALSRDDAGRPHMPMPGNVGPWDELAEWYWSFWNVAGGQLPLENSVEEDEGKTAHQCPHLYGPSVEFDTIKKVPRATLIALYFKHIHPLCPIFDEVAFHLNFNSLDTNISAFERITMAEFHAIMFAGSLHLNSDQLLSTPYKSTLECHTALFEVAKESYHNSQSLSPLALTRVALLLSYWSPYNSEQQTNTYWIEQAFMHARAANIHIEPTSDSCYSRNRLIWWSLLLRDRLVTFALRKSRFYDEVSSHTMVCEEDFGIEAQCPLFLDLISKARSIHNFIYQCKLSQIITQILKFQELRGYGSIGWKEVSMLELYEVVSLYNQLKAWRAEFEYSFPSSEDAVDFESCNMPCQLSYIFCDGAIASLYLPYTFLNPDNYSLYADEVSQMATNKIMDAVSRIAKRAGTLGMQDDANDVPLILGAWIVFPIAVKLILLSSADLADPTQDLQEMRGLMKLLYILKHRFSGGKFVSSVIDAVILKYTKNRACDDQRDTVSLLQDAASTIESSLARGVIPLG